SGHHQTFSFVPKAGMFLQLRKGTWLPEVRIEGLLRFAFIGDSMAYGTGVTPDQTLPANAERQMNELLPGWPIEVVNLGVPGYNLWNSWLKFKRSPQVYNGVVFIVCINDAELFGITLRVPYPLPASSAWESTRATGRAVECCFDDISEFSAKNSLPVAIVFYVTGPLTEYQQMGEIISDLCAERALFYLNTWNHLRELNLTPAELRASPSDAHPSVKVHQASSRNLVQALYRKGWFDRYSDRAIATAPNRIQKAARAMVEADHYPAELACNWALGVLESKERLAARMEAVDGPSGFSSAAEPVVKELTAASNCWHISQRLHAFVQTMATHDARVAEHLLNGIVIERQTVDELGFGLEMGGWEEICTECIDLSLARNNSEPAPLSEASAILTACRVDLQKARTALDGLRTAILDRSLGWPVEESLFNIDLEIVESILRQLESEIELLQTSFLRAQKAYGNVSKELSLRRQEQVLKLLGQPLRSISSRFSIVKQWKTTLERMRDQRSPGFTTVEVTLSAEPVEGTKFPVLLGQVEYLVPWRLPFSNAGLVSPDGDSSLAKLTFPTFYSARIRLTRSTPTMGPSKFNLIKVEIYNCVDQRRSIDPASFRLLPNGAYESPPVHLL
ncbi:MAG: SGNH/GDSL hydrolase family protein, partial [Terracidiphilus sp.]